MRNAEPMRIELLVVPGCPNAQPAADRLRQALDELGLTDATFASRTITQQSEAAAAHFTGSPTILINGHDPFAERCRPPGVTCRMYRTPHGLAGLPETGQLREALAGASALSDQSGTRSKQA